MKNSIQMSWGKGRRKNKPEDSVTGFAKVAEIQAQNVLRCHLIRYLFECVLHPAISSAVLRRPLPFSRFPGSDVSTSPLSSFPNILDKVAMFVQAIAGESTSVRKYELPRKSNCFRSIRHVSFQWCTRGEKTIVFPINELNLCITILGTSRVDAWTIELLSGSSDFHTICSILRYIACSTCRRCLICTRQDEKFARQIRLVNSSSCFIGLRAIAFFIDFFLSILLQIIFILIIRNII